MLKGKHDLTCKFLPDVIFASYQVIKHACGLVKSV